MRIPGVITIAVVSAALACAGEPVGPAAHRVAVCSVVNDEAKVGLVEAHPQSDSRHQDFDLILEESVLQTFPLVCVHGAVIGLRINSLRLKPVR